MFYSGNFTHKELMSVAMPMVSLSREEWNILLKHIKQVEQTEVSESCLLKAFEKVISNQAKLEVSNKYMDSHMKELDDPVNEESSWLYPLM